jgi:hypothetical protein
MCENCKYKNDSPDISKLTTEQLETIIKMTDPGEIEEYYKKCIDEVKI